MFVFVFQGDCPLTHLNLAGNGLTDHSVLLIARWIFQLFCYYTEMSMHHLYPYFSFQPLYNNNNDYYCESYIFI